MNGHLPVELLSGYLDERVGPEDRRRVEGHLDGCAACRRTLAGLRRAVTLVQGLEPVAAPEGLRAAVRAQLQESRPARGGLHLWPRVLPMPGRPTWRTALTAAAVLLIGLFSVNLLLQTPAGREFGKSVSQPSIGGLPVGTERPQARAPESRVPLERQVIRTATLEVQVADFEEGSRALVRIAESSGGFVADSTTSREEPPYGTFVLRLPAPRFAEVLERIEGLGKVTARRVSGQDVTEEFVDLQARIRNLEHHERQLLTFMDRATRVADLLAIEQELSRVRGEIEQLTGRLRFLGNRVEMATVEVTLREKARQGSAIFWDFAASLHRVQAAFLGTIRQLLALSERVLVLVSALVPVAVLAAAGWALIRWLLRRNAATL